MSKVGISERQIRLLMNFNMRKLVCKSGCNPGFCSAWPASLLDQLGQQQHYGRWKRKAAEVL
jgi:hypothetical protein